MKVLILKTHYFHTKLISEANVKTNRIVSTKWIYHKKWSFASNYFIFLKFHFIIRTSYKDLIWCINYPNVHIDTFRKRWSFIWGCFFPVSILKTSKYSISIWGPYMWNSFLSPEEKQVTSMNHGLLYLHGPTLHILKEK